MRVNIRERKIYQNSGPHIERPLPNHPLKQKTSGKEGIQTQAQLRQDVALTYIGFVSTQCFKRFPKKKM